MKKKIAVVGAGFFGTTIALMLKNYDVTLFEKNNKILTGASKKNQFRFHLGYHYPRSSKTLKEVKSLSNYFINYFKKDILGSTINYYGISKKDSKINYKRYLKFLKNNGLFFKENKNNFFNSKIIEGSIISKEKNLNYFKIEKKIKKLIQDSHVKLRLNREFKKNYLPNFNKVIIACYDQNNIILNKIGFKPKKKCRFELVEKIVIKLPKKFSNKSFMVLDGKFVSLDPYLGTRYHLLSDVKHSKIEVIKKGYFPNFKSPKRKYLKKGLIKDIKISNFKKFIERCSLFLPFLKDAKYVGSFFVTRSIEINKEKTDERLNSILKYNKKIYTVHSGKWNTSVGLAKDLVAKVTNE